MQLTQTRFGWILVNTGSSLPYILMMVYLLWVHGTALRQSSKRSVPALRTAFLITLITSASFLFNQPPFRFMVSQELNALVKDLTLVVQAFLMTIWADQLRGRVKRRQWIALALGALLPIAHTTWWYLQKSSITRDPYSVVRVPLILTAYTLFTYAYAWVQFRAERRASGSHQFRWRLGTLMWCLIAIMLYVVGRGTMEFLPESLRIPVVWVNRLGLTIGTLLMVLGLASPGWFVRLGALAHMIRHGGQHLDNFVGLLGMISDREISLRSPARVALRDTAVWIASRLELPTDSRVLIYHAAQLSPISEVHPGRPVPVPEPLQQRRMDVTSSVILYSSVFEVVSAVLEPGAGRISLEAQILIAARFYLEGRTMAEIQNTCPPEVAGVITGLISAQSA